MSDTTSRYRNKLISRDELNAQYKERKRRSAKKYQEKQSSNEENAKKFRQKRAQQLREWRKKQRQLEIKEFNNLSLKYQGSVSN